MSVRYVDVDSPDLERFPPLARAVSEGRGIPLVLVGDTVKSPAVLSFAWIVNEFKSLGVLE
ncbi:MAG: hypothetical protein Kow00122_02520 [Thermoleophilia bacterium]